MTKLDWENITNYIDSVGTTDTVFPFAKVQSSVKVTASGARDNIIYTIGGQSGTLLPGQSVTVTGTISSMTLRSASGRQPFQVWAVEAGTEKDETDTSYQGQIDGLTTQLAQKMNKGESILVSQIDKNQGKLDQTYMTDEFLQQMAGTTPINAVPADNSLVESKFAFPVISGEKSKNIFNKATITVGKAFTDTYGNLVDVNGYSVSDFIPVEPNQTYTISHKNQILFFDSTKTAIPSSKIYVDGDAVNTPFTFTTQSDYAFLRVDIVNSVVDVLQIEKGDVPTSYASFKNKITLDDISDEITNKINMIDKSQFSNDTFDFLSTLTTDIVQDLENPFIRTVIGCPGDSITAAVGSSTQRDLTVDNYQSYGATILFVNNLGNNHYSLPTSFGGWVNLLKSYIETNYNKDSIISLSHPKINNGDKCSIIDLTSYYLHQGFELPNTGGNINGSVNFRFYGDHFKVFLDRYTNRGNVDIYVDGVKVQTVDCYDTSFQPNVETSITGLTLDYHDVSIVRNNVKNPSSTDYSVVLSYLVIPKTASVIGYGYSGSSSNYAYWNKDKIFTDATDYYIMQYGTNDRTNGKDIEYAKNMNRNICKYVKGLNKKIILVCSCPAGPTKETNELKMKDIHNSLKQVAYEMQVPFISNYEMWTWYTQTKGITISSLLADDLHPNDAGHELMFQTILHGLGLAR